MEDIGGNKLSSDKSWSFYIPTLKWADGYKSSDYLASERAAFSAANYSGQNIQYLAQAFRLSQQTTIRFMGFGLCINSGSSDNIPNKLDISSNNNTKPSSSIISCSNVIHATNESFFGSIFYSDNGTAYITNNVCTCDLDTNKITLSGNTTYWIVASFPGKPDYFHLTLGDNLPSVGNNILESTDGSNWIARDNITNWLTEMTGRSLRLFLSD